MTAMAGPVSNIGLVLANREIDGPRFRSVRKGDFGARNGEAREESWKRIKVGSSIGKQIEGNPSFVSKLELKTMLKKHRGCVNTIQWSPEGDLLVTGSDDCQLNIWSFPDYKLRTNLKPGHSRNIFSAHFVPFSSNQELVSAGMDGEVRFTDIPKKSSNLLGSFPHMVYKIVLQPGNPNMFLTTHQDGKIILFDLRGTGKPGKYHEILIKPKAGKETSCNSLSFDPLDTNTFAVGTDAFIRIFDIRKINNSKPESDCVRRFCPQPILDTYDQKHEFNRYYITGTDFNTQGEIVATYSRGDVFCIDSREPISEKELIQSKSVPTSGIYKQCYRGRQNVRTFLKEVAFFGNNNYVATGSDCGHLFIWDKHTGDLVQLLKADESVVNGVAPHSQGLPILATCGIDSEGKIYEPGEKITFDPVKAQRVVKDNESDNSHEDEEGGLDLVQLWNLLARFRAENRAGAARQQQEVQEEEEEESEEEQAPEESDNEEVFRFLLEKADRTRNKANELFKKAKYEEAIQKYDSALKKLNFSDAPEAIQKEAEQPRLLCMLNKAACFLKLAKYDEVVEQCTEVLTIDPNSAKALFRRGSAFYHQKKFELAKTDLEKAAVLMPESAEIRQLLQDIQKILSKKS